MNKSIKVVLDADQQGELMVFFAEYHTYLVDQLHSACNSIMEGLYEDLADADTTITSIADAIYLLGNFESKAFSNCLDTGSLEIIDTWQNDLAMSKGEMPPN